MHLQDIMNSINNMVVEQGETVGESNTLYSQRQRIYALICHFFQSTNIMILNIVWLCSLYYYYYYLDNIESHVERAAVEVEAGRIKLGAAARYKVRERREEALFIIAFT